MKRTVVALTIASIGFFASGCEMPAEESSGSGSGSGEPNSKPIQVEAKQILKEFEGNEAAADGKYKDKTLEVSGVVSKVDTEFFDDEQYVIQVGAGTAFDIFTVNCDDQASENVSSIKKGQGITVVGDFEDGGDLGIELANCQIK